MQSFLVKFFNHLSTKKIAVAAAIYSFVLVLMAILFEHLLDLTSCPLCLVQRAIFIILGLLFLFLAAVEIYKKLYLLLAAITTSFAVLGTALAMRQSYLQLYPDPDATCGASFEYILSNMPILDIFSYLLEGSSNCQKIQWQLFGLSIPMWAILCFLVLVIISVYLFISRKNNLGD